MDNYKIISIYVLMEDKLDIYKKISRYSYNKL